ncbi:MAG: transglutaminase-like domain-containing protein [Spirochaetia bacterium]|nr:transglutaminase-like domain-containing protein [Spirochaetia bacterium]
MRLKYLIKSALNKFKSSQFSFICFTVLLTVFAQCSEKKLSTGGEVTFKITIDAPFASKDVKLWLPYPTSDKLQTIKNVKINGNYNKQLITHDTQNDIHAVYAEWNEPINNERYLTFTFTASSIEHKVQPLNDDSSTDLPAEIIEFTKATRYIPTSGKIKEVALKTIGNKKTILTKSRAIYDWIVDNIKRDPRVIGCGTGEVEKTIQSMSGKCADVSTVYVAMARAAGVPAREVFGMRLGSKSKTDITDGHHCWAEFYLPKKGWVPVDPSDVLKTILVKEITIEEALPYREYYFGSVDANRIVLARGGRDIYLNPKQNDAPLNYFMYPYAEVDGKALEWLAAQDKLKYQITYHNL